MLLCIYFVFAEILNSYDSGSLQLSTVKADICNYDLLDVLLLSLKQDFAKLPQGWQTASKLANILRYIIYNYGYIVEPLYIGHPLERPTRH